MLMKSTPGLRGVELFHFSSLVKPLSFSNVDYERKFQSSFIFLGQWKMNAIFFSYRERKSETKFKAVDEKTILKYF